MAVKIIWAITGSVAAKLSEKIARFSKEPEVGDFRMITTSAASEFTNVSNFRIGDDVPIFDDNAEVLFLRQQQKVLHVELGRLGDVLVIAPCTANTLAKLANGLADNLVTCTALAWDLENKKIIVAPAMNTRMWLHPATQNNVMKLETYGIKVIPPVEKELYCKELGVGALAPLEEILKAAIS